MAQWYLTHLPSSGVAYWYAHPLILHLYISSLTDPQFQRDFDAPAPTSYDTSSSLIVVSALLYLSSVEASNGNSTGSDYWSNSAVTLLGNVVNVGVDGWNGASLVGNGTVNNRASPFVTFLSFPLIELLYTEFFWLLPADQRTILE